MHGRFVWHDLMTTNVATALEFYSKLFPEWKFKEIELGGGFTYNLITVEAEGKAYEVGGIASDPGIGFPSCWVGYISTPSCDEAIERVEAKGGSCVVPPFDMPDVGRIALVADAQGAVVKPYEPETPIEAPPRYGAGLFVWNELLTTDIAQARELYAHAFGWSLAEHNLGPMGMYTLFKVDGKDVAGGMNMPPDVKAPAHWLIYLGAEDVDSRGKKAESLGAKTLVAPKDIPGIGRFGVYNDPTGAMFALYKPAAK